MDISVNQIVRFVGNSGIQGTREQKITSDDGPVKA